MILTLLSSVVTIACQLAQTAKEEETVVEHPIETRANFCKPTSACTPQAPKTSSTEVHPSAHREPCSHARHIPQTKQTWLPSEPTCPCFSALTFGTSHKQNPLPIGTPYNIPVPTKNTSDNPLLNKQPQPTQRFSKYLTQPAC